MQRDHMKAPIIVGWALSLAAIAMSLNAGSPTAWLLLVGVGLLPPMMLFGICRQPAPTMSQKIREMFK
jgi:hypothetical protein